MNTGAEKASPIDRIPTGVPGLDEILGGGLLRSGVYIFQGSPGAGKTILANHIVHRHAAEGGKVVYVTLLAESHARLFQHMESFAFFHPDVVPEKVYYVSAFHALRSHGLKGVIELLRTEMRSHQAGILVLDGLVMAASAAESDEELKLFISDIQTHSTLSGCTTLLLTSENPDRPVSAEQTMVDGIVLLRERAFGVRRERNLEVVKFRGSSTLRGNHSFRIGPQGIVVYPRLESARRPGPTDGVQRIGVSTGVPGLDAMFDINGYAKGSVTALSGPSGCGKTSLALHFAAQARPGESALFVGFYEPPALLRQVAATLGLQLPTDPSALEFMWQSFGENMLDELAAGILERVAKGRHARVVIDGAGGLMATPGFSDRGGAFLAALTSELRALGTTSLITVEQMDATRALVLDSATMSALADNVLDLHMLKSPAMRRFATIRKSRVSRCDLRERELMLTPTGVALVEEPSVGD